MKMRFVGSERLPFVFAAIMGYCGPYLVVECQAQNAQPEPAGFIDRFRNEVEQFADQAGGCSKEQRQQFNQLEIKLSGEVRAHPEKADDFVYFNEAFDQFLNVLTPKQKEKWVEIGEARVRKEMSTAKNLHFIGLNRFVYAVDHGMADPGDLGLLADSLPAYAFLTPDSQKKVPTAADWDALDDQAKKKWVDLNTDFVYLPKPGKLNESADFVVAYVRPEMSRNGNTFLMGDGSAHEQPRARADEMVALLLKGVNPPQKLAKAPTTNLAQEKVEVSGSKVEVSGSSVEDKIKDLRTAVEQYADITGGCSKSQRDQFDQVQAKFLADLKLHPEKAKDGRFLDSASDELFKVLTPDQIRKMTSLPK